MSFQVGQKVVCISGGWVHLADCSEFTGPATGDIVTISWIKKDILSGRDYLGFNEWTRNNWGPLPVYYSKYFRPIDYSVGEIVCEHITKICETETI